MRNRENEIKHNQKNEEKRINRENRRKELKYLELQSKIEGKKPRPKKIIEILKPVAEKIKEPKSLKKESIWILLIWLPLKRLLLKIKRIFRR